MIKNNNGKEVCDFRYLPLNPCHLGLAAGIVCGISMLIFTILAVQFGYARQVLELGKGVYPGYDVTIAGAFVGLIWGFLKGFIGFSLIAWLYNSLNCCCHSCPSDKASKK